MTFEYTQLELDRAMALMDLGRFREAEEHLLRILDKAPQVAIANASMCELTSRKSDYKSARYYAERVIEIAPSRSDGWRLLAHVAMDDAAFDLPRSTNWWRYEGANKDIARVRFARKMASEAIRLDPDEPYNHLMLAHAQVALGNRRRADASISTALSLAPTNKHARIAEIDSCRRANKTAAARRLTQRLLTEYPDDSEVHAVAALVADEQGDYATASTHAREAVQGQPDSESRQAAYWEAEASRSWIMLPAIVLRRFLITIARLPLWIYVTMIVALFAAILLASDVYGGRFVEVATLLFIAPLLLARMIGEDVRRWVSDFTEPILLFNRKFRSSRTAEQKLDLVLCAAFLMSFIGCYTIGAISQDGRYVALAWLSGLICTTISFVAKISPSWIRGFFGAVTGVWSILILFTIVEIVWRPQESNNTMLVASFLIGIILAVGSYFAAVSE